MDSFDMHEVLLTRGDVQGCTEKVRSFIMVSCNCALVHHGQCHIDAVTQDGKRKCIESLIAHEGYNEIVAWLDKMDGLLVSEQAQWAKNLVTEVNNDLQSLQQADIAT